MSFKIRSLHRSSHINITT